LVDVLNKITRVIEEPGFDPELPLDMRGTADEIKVWSVLRALPIGKTISYDAFAAKLGTRRRPRRDQGDRVQSDRCARCMPSVIEKDGSISGYRRGMD
jgi:AraC family transcriptional regulator, regulatory protein of adaptative response / methylated-DNA-[protein]-cysteine methyltransferase